MAPLNQLSLEKSDVGTDVRWLGTVSSVGIPVLLVDAVTDGVLDSEILAQTHRGLCTLSLNAMKKHGPQQIHLKQHGVTKRRDMES